MNYCFLLAILGICSGVDQPVSPELRNLREVVNHIRESYRRPLRLLTDDEVQREQQDAEINSFIIH